ncbi:MAG: hypothetical protein AB7V18_15585 [Pyrinomonadaceae bacterium]
MESRNQNEVIVQGLNSRSVDLKTRSLDLEKIRTPELSLLSPKRDEIASPGVGREEILVAYADRLRNSYRQNENGFRDGLAMLAETIDRGQAIAIFCSCRGGEMCHADVVKMAIEKVGVYLKERQSASMAPAMESAQRPQPALAGNIRTERAITEILSYSENDRLLARIDDTDGRSRSEHSEYLNQFSQFAREAYEQGATTRDGILVLPTDQPALAKPLAISTNEHAVKRLTRILGDEKRAAELAPEVIEAGHKIAGFTPDRETTLKVFSSIYESLEGKYDFLPNDQPAERSESSSERFNRNLQSITRLAGEMSELEPADGLAAGAGVNDDPRDEVEYSYESKEGPPAIPQAADGEKVSSLLGIGYERIDLREPLISKLIAQTSADERERWFNDRFQRIDRDLERGVPISEILQRFRKTVYQTSMHDPANAREALADLKIASAYVDHQLMHPESRLRHENERYRNYASMLESASTRSEVISAASAIRLENAKDGLAWTNGEMDGLRPLTAREMQFLFTEVSPRHYTSEMTVSRLAYSHAGVSRNATTNALMRDEIPPSPEARTLIDSLESRLERRYEKDSISATKHFLESLRTPDHELRYRNSFDHSEVYRKLPPAEKDFVYNRAVQQKEYLQDAAAVRQSIKRDLIELLSGRPISFNDDLAAQTSRVIELHLGKSDFPIDRDKVAALGHEVGERIRREIQSQERSVNSRAVQRANMNGFDNGSPHNEKDPLVRQPIKERSFEQTYSR